MANIELNKLVEVLDYLLEHGPSSTYDIYKHTRLSLATAYRYVKRASELGYVVIDDVLVDITIKGVLLLALLGNEDAIHRLAMAIGFRDEVIRAFVNVLRGYDGIIDLLGRMRVESVGDLLRLLLVINNNNNLIKIVKYYSNTLLEPLIAYLIINFMPNIELPNSTKVVISNDGVVAVACNSPDENCPYRRGDSIYRNRNDGFIYRLMCSFDCVRGRIDDISIGINVNVNSHFNSVEIHLLNQGRKMLSNGSTKDRGQTD